LRKCHNEVPDPKTYRPKPCGFIPQIHAAGVSEKILPVVDDPNKTP
jgi:hypothetical protein